MGVRKAVVQYEEHLADLKAEYEERITELEDGHEEEITYLQEENERLRTARDDLQRQPYHPR